MKARALVLAAAAAATLAAGGCATNPVTGKSDVVTMSLAQEVELGRKMHPQILREYGLYQDEALQAYVNELGQRIAAKSHRPDLQYTFTVLDSEEVNAFQADWNLDKLNGTGASGITLNLTNATILVIDLQWLGMGRVRVGFDIGGNIVYAHEFRNANVLTEPYMQTANLSIRWESVGNGVSTMYATCSAVISEGGADKFLGYQFAYNRASVTAADGVQTYAFSIRPKSTFNSITNRMLIRPLTFGCLVTGNFPVLTEIYYGTTMGGSPSWSDMDATYSGHYYLYA